MSEETTLYCDFCGKSQHEVRKLIAGGRSMICDECVVLCCDILIAERHFLNRHRDMIAADIGL